MIKQKEQVKWIYFIFRHILKQTSRLLVHKKMKTLVIEKNALDIRYSGRGRILVPEPPDERGTHVHRVEPMYMHRTIQTRSGRF